MATTTIAGRCLVLGGRGFIGSHLVDRLLEDGVAVRVLIRRLPADAEREPYRSHPLLDVCYGDFNNMLDLMAAMKGCSSCVHLISSTLPKNSNDNMVYDIQTNLVGTVGLLQAAKQLGLSKLVFLSSGGTVYGDVRQIPIDEDHPTNPKTSYGVTKLAIEKYMSIFASDALQTVVLRLSNPFGPRQRTNTGQGAIAVFLTSALKGQEINIWGDGSVVRDYVYVADCVSAIARALAYDGHAVINIGSGVGRSLTDVLADIEAVLGRRLVVNYEPARGLDASRNVLSIGRAERLLGWRPITPFATGLAQTAEWYAKALA
jgi:UDP-glucose 4-epimerase